MLPLLKPTLFAATISGPVLLGGRCECGYVFFPMQTYGCERCGKRGSALQAITLRARGKLITASVVHLHADKRRPVPFAIATIALDDGPVIRAVLSDVELADSALANQAPYKAVVGEWVAIALEDGNEALDLRFYSEAKDTASQGER